jgi:hypothetical protein
MKSATVMIKHPIFSTFNPKANRPTSENMMGLAKTAISTLMKTVTQWLELAMPHLSMFIWSTPNKPHRVSVSRSYHHLIHNCVMLFLPPVVNAIVDYR